MLRVGQTVTMKDGKVGKIEEFSYRIKAAVQEGRLVMEREASTPRVSVRLPDGEQVWVELEELEAIGLRPPLFAVFLGFIAVAAIGAAILWVVIAK